MSWCGLGGEECAYGEPRCTVHVLLSERQQLQKERDGLFVARNDALADLLEARLQRKQAIDALREALTMCHRGSKIGKVISAALVRLGEQG